MAATSILGGINQETTQQKILDEISSQPTASEVLSVDTPATVRLVGDPDGDWQDQDLLQLVMDPQSGVRLQTEVANQPRTDANNALLVSDAPVRIELRGVVNQILIIDTQGYQTLNITSQTIAGGLSASNELGGPWTTLSGTAMLLGPIVTAVTAGASFNFPCLARYLKFTTTTGGIGSAYLRSQAWDGTYTTQQQQNITFLNGTAPVTGGVAGTLAVGGNVAVGITPTTNPLLIGGVDSTTTVAGVANPLVRRVLTDTLGRVETKLTGLDPTNLARVLGVVNLPDRPPTTGALSVVDHAQFEGMNIPELLIAMLTEMRITNQYLYELPRLMNDGVDCVDEPQAFRNDSTFFNQ